MKTILCYGDSNVWGSIPGKFNPDTGLSGRYPKNKRWTGVLEKKLGENYNIVEAGISARTTNLDEIVPGRPYKNGLTLLPPCLETHYPIDLVIFMLGTNDVKIQYNRTTKEIAEGLRELIKIIKTSNKGPAANPPKILLITPHPVIKIENLHPQFDDHSIEKSKKLSALYQQLAKEEQCYWLDAGQIVKTSQVDGIHLDEHDCELLGKAVAEKVKEIL